MTDIVAAWTDQGWCDACKTNIEAHPHEPGCPIAEIIRLREAFEALAGNDFFIYAPLGEEITIRTVQQYARQVLDKSF